MRAAAVTILLSSFLLFLVQPILAKQMLPWFGGSAGVWAVCLVFFQAVLVLGYAYAHWLSRARAASRQFTLHIALLLASCLTLPVIPGSFWKPTDAGEPTLRILGLLAATAGMPYFLLASTAPLLQKWLSTAGSTASQRLSIYRLYALSNFGSLVGLLCYPFVIEPFAPVRTQAWVWSAGYGLFVICSVAYAWVRRRLPDLPAEAGTPAAEQPPSLRRYAYWIGCAALGSALLLSTTNQMTQNVAAVPLLWLVPLSLYLLSFTICFEGRSGRGWYERRYWLTPAMLATGAMAWALYAEPTVYVALPVFAVGLFLACVVCHGELAARKPGPQYLTHFYLSLSVGGALGGLLVGLAAPQLFSGYWEMPLALVALALLGVRCSSRETGMGKARAWATSVLLAAVAAALILLMLGDLPKALDAYTLPWTKIAEGDARWGLLALMVVCAVLFQRYRVWTGVALTALACAVTLGCSYYQRIAADTAYAARNFYGTLRVVAQPYPRGRTLRLRHGTTLHGLQVMRLPERKQPTTYYSETSGIGRALLSEERAGSALRVGSVGLGAGTLAAYGRPGDLFRMYEINPAVLDIATNRFAYLSDSGASIEPVLGDARLSLERELASGDFGSESERFDVLSLDAFSGDAIPVHLLTREAFAVYTRVTKPDGIIAFHLSNRYLDLPPIIGQIARDAGFQAVLIADRPRVTTITNASDWVLVTRNAAFLRQTDIAAHSQPIASRGSLPIWTDQFTNLFQILK